MRAGKDGQPQSQVFSYQYDALGRRIAKTDSFGTTVFTWEGMRLLQESRGAQTSTYIYEPGSYVPLARIDGAGAIEPHPAAAHALGGDAEQGKQGSVPTTNPQWADRFNVAAAANDEPGGSSTPNVRQGAGGEDIAQVYYFHTQPNGLPEELSDNSGNLVWRAQYATWGSTVREEWQSFHTAGRPQHQLASQTASLQQNLRMQGQYLDRETGLHYNTFRYYDADLGAFTTPDPIGLNGGLNLHQYAPNPISWIDPWGWASKGYDVSGQTAGHDTVSRGAHVNVHGPGLPNGGGHVGFVPNEKGTGLTMTREDAATRNLNDKQWAKVQEAVGKHLDNPKEVDRLSKIAQMGVDNNPKGNRAGEMAKVRDIARQHHTAGTNPCR
ncbi:RHS repeat-associated core domain-containing protein [Acidovorax sp. LjRoot194]|uniref:RHS repeat-associated core domain-containing protein n=1 Tax=Acidovorax sp. LjRoot194 TaxID=3342280 RepID=UPI003ECC6925